MTSRLVGGVPFRLWVGVTGHRTLDDAERLASALDNVLQRIRLMVPLSPHTPVRLGVVSPLAEGADRLVARMVLHDAEATLEAALPLPPEDYLEDFHTEASRQEFSSLLGRASMVTVLPAGGSREEAYTHVGHYVVDRCDVLIAVWDGLPPRGPGGTAETVAHARERGVPLFWINPHRPQELREEAGNGVSERDFLEIDAFNRAQIRADQFAAELDQHTSQLLACGAGVGLDQDAVRPHLAWSVPHLVRADLLARRHQRQYLRLGNLLFGTSFLAVALAAVQSLASPTVVWLTAVEAVLMFALLVAVLYGRRRRVHARWISYRRLAERLRIALFQGIAALGLSRMVSWDRIDIDPARDWVRRLFEEAWITRPLVAPGRFSPPALRDFLTRAWLEDQLAYHRRSVRRYERRDRLLSRTIAALFGVTLVALLFRGFPDSVPDAQRFLLLLSTTGPALATALSGIRAQREYLQHAENSRQMASQLKILRRRMLVAPDLPTIQTLAHTTGMLMIDENQDWYATMQPHDFEVQM